MFFFCIVNTNMNGNSGNDHKYRIYVALRTIVPKKRSQRGKLEKKESVETRDKVNLKEKHIFFSL